MNPPSPSEAVRCVSAPKAGMWCGTPPDFHHHSTPNLLGCYVDAMWPHPLVARFCVDLQHRRLVPSHYTLKHYSSWDTEALRNWKFEVSARACVLV